MTTNRTATRRRKSTLLLAVSVVIILERRKAYHYHLIVSESRKRTPIDMGTSVRPSSPAAAGCSSDHHGNMKPEKMIGFWRFTSVRLRIGILLCMNYFVLAYIRHSLGMAMVCMVNSTAVGILTGVSNVSDMISGEQASTEDQQPQQDSCPITSRVRHDYEGEFVWTPDQQGMLFAAIYWGSLAILPAGFLADRYSPKRILSFAILLNALGSALTPTAAEYGGYTALFVVRCVMGIGQGLLVPAASAFLCRWIPANERSTVISLYTAGNQLAGIAGMPFSAWLCQFRTTMGGWPMIFFSGALLALANTLIWSLCVAEAPKGNKNDQARRQSDSPKVEKAAGFVFACSSPADKKRKVVPWKAMVSSSPVWSCVVCNFADGISTATLSSYLPTYFMEVLHLELHTNGVYSAAPSLVQAVAKFGMAALSDKLKASGKISTTTNCKIFNTVGFIGTAAFLVACSFLSCAQGTLAITFICLSSGLFAGTTPGFMTSQVALAPAYAGTVSAVSTVAFQIGSIVAPYFVGAITTNGTRQEWQIVFISISAILLFAGLIFLVFGSANMQSWAKCTPPASIPDVAAIVVPNHHRNHDALVRYANRHQQQHQNWAHVSSLDILPAGGCGVVQSDCSL